MTLLTGSSTLAGLTTKRIEDSVKRQFTVASMPPSATCQSLLIKMIIDGIRIDPKTSFKDLRSFKNYHRDELNNFRNGLNEITSMKVPDGIDYDGMVQTVSDIYERKIRLPYNDLKAALKGAHINFLTDISSLAYTGISTKVFGGITNLSAPMQLLVGTGIYVAVECIKNYANKCNLKRTSKMSYLLSIDNELGGK